jgi:hypothetical protein
LYINTRKIQVIALAFFALLPPDTFQPSACESPRGNTTGWGFGGFAASLFVVFIFGLT